MYVCTHACAGVLTLALRPPAGGEAEGDLQLQTDGGLTTRVRPPAAHAARPVVQADLGRVKGHRALDRQHRGRPARPRRFRSEEMRIREWGIESGKWERGHGVDGETHSWMLQTQASREDEALAIATG